MTSTTNRQIVLASRPDGLPTATDFEIVEQTLPALKDGQVRFRNRLISVDPYQRNLMGNGPSELPAIDLGTPMQGPTVATVEESRNPGFVVGDDVVTWSGWQEAGISDGSDLRKIDTAQATASTALGALGHTGLTAWVGLTKVIQPTPGGTLVVTSAAGAVGSIAAQIAKLLNLYLYRYIEIQGFSLLDHLDSFPEFLAEVGPWVADGQIKHREHFVDGFDQIFPSFLKLFHGQNTGKLIVRI